MNAKRLSAKLNRWAASYSQYIDKDDKDKIRDMVAYLESFDRTWLPDDMTASFTHERPPVKSEPPTARVRSINRNNKKTKDVNAQFECPLLKHSNALGRFDIAKMIKNV